MGHINKGSALDYASNAPLLTTYDHLGHLAWWSI